MAMQQISQKGTAYTPPATAQSKNAIARFLHACGEFLLEYWAHIITIALGTLVFIAISIPFLSYLGLDSIAKPLFYALHLVCAQIPSHSFYIFGHQLGMCERNFTIYTSMFLASLIFVLTKKRLPGIPWWLWLLMILPMALDGTSQMFGLRESTWYLRVLTGSLFGLANIWFALPMMQKSLLDVPPPVPLSRRHYSSLVKMTQK
jgi:uncharacterized membrane protein